MMRGTRLLHLPVSFKYSDGGKYAEDSAVTLQAPSLDNFAIHTKMVAYATQAMMANEKEQMQMLAELGDTLDKILKSRDAMREQAIAEGKVEADAEAAETDDAMAARVMSTYARGLGPDRFPAFMEFVKKTLTNNAKLARVGETKVPLRDESWEDIDAKGGMDAVNIVLAGFAGFFLRTVGSESRDANGNSSQPTSPSLPAVH
jgi:hypothetical protein